MSIDPSIVWIAIVVLSIGTYFLRAVFLLGVEWLDDLPPVATRVLPFVPIAILAALVSPSLAYLDGSLRIGLGNEQLLAGLVAIVVAWRTESMLATVVVGMAVLWTLQWML